MAFLLELRGILTLHASAVQAGEGAVVFLAAAGGGKSSLAAAFAAAGFPMLGDDLVAVKEAGGGWEALPGPPRLKLGRESLERLGISPERLPPVGDHPSKRWLAPDKEGWGPILDTPCGLRRIYLPVRESGSTGGGEPRIVPIDPLQAVQEILRHGCAPGAAEAMGLRAARMERIARLVESVPMDRLAYPNGFEHLDRVIESVLEQLDRKGR